MTPKVSIVIPVYNNAEDLLRCLNALAAQDYPQEQFEVLVVDNGSTTSVSPTVEPFPFVKLLREPTPGSYAARNLALAHVSGDVIGFTDADCVPEPNWIRTGVTYLNNPGSLRVVGGHIPLFAQEPRRPTWIESYEIALGFPQRKNVECLHYSVTANLFTNKRTVDRVGNFNADLLSGGDKEWGQRAYAAGAELLFAEDLVVHHPARRDWNALKNKRTRHMGGFVTAAKAKYPAPLAYSLVFSKACLPPFKRLLNARTEQGCGLRGKAETYAKVWCVASALQLHSAKEVVKLALGAQRTR